MTDPPRVLLLSMPFGALDRPSIGLGTLKAGLAADGIACDVAYPALTFAAFTGVRDYQWVAGDLPHTAFAGEWLFTEQLYGRRPDQDARYEAEVLHSTWQLDAAAVRRLRRIRAWCRPLLDHCMAGYDWDKYDVVGFTSTFEQNIASLALARRLKQAHPRLVTAFGGANWEGEMGLELARRFPFVDLVCSGEADVSFRSALRALAGGPSALGAVPGIVFRDADGVPRATAAGEPVTDLDSVPPPDYDDYFGALAASPVLAGVIPRLLIETSRGCWWGARHHCTFCGLNGLSMGYRAKSPDRVLDELDSLVDRYRVPFVSAVDNIMDMAAFRSFLPRLAARDGGPSLSLFYETKANLRHTQIRLLRAAGVDHIQPGLESLSGHVLRLMRKGTTVLQNVQLLKWCRELDVVPEWNLLYGFPGETPADYAEMLAVVDAIDFLQPPSGVGPVRLDRFSPYHRDPAAFGLVGVRPMAVYRYLYPFPEDVLTRIAYYFDYDHADGRVPLRYAGPLVERVQRWSARGAGPGVWQTPTPGDTLSIVDQRYGAGWRLSGWRAAVYAACDEIRGIAHLEELARHGGGSPADLAAFLDWLRQRRLLLSEEDRHLALAVHRPARTAVPPPDPPRELLPLATAGRGSA